MIEIRNWAFMNYQGAYTLSTRDEIRLSGTVTGDARFTDGTFIITSKIISCIERSIITEKGSHYLLIGSPEKSWEEQCSKKGWNIDHDFPLNNEQVRKNI